MIPAAQLPKPGQPWVCSMHRAPPTLRELNDDVAERQRIIDLLQRPDDELIASTKRQPIFHDRSDTQILEINSRLCERLKKTQARRLEEIRRLEDSITSTEIGVV